MIVFAFSLFSTLTTSLVTFYLISAFCTYATLFASMLNSESFPLNDSISSVCILKIDSGMFSSIEAKINFTCSGHSLSGPFNKAVPVRHSITLSSSMLIALLPMSGGMLMPLTCCHFETSLVPVPQLPDWRRTRVVYDENYVSTAIL